MMKGIMIGDSLRAGAELKPNGWRVTRIWRFDWSATKAPDQPPVGTTIEFEGEDEQADELAEALSTDEP